MIYAHIDSPTTKNIVGFECGNRADYDTRHGGDPLWIFLDKDQIYRQIVTKDFLMNPRAFYLDKHGYLQKKFVPTMRTPSIIGTLTDEDGTPLKDADGAVLTEPLTMTPLPAGYVYVTDGNGNYVTDSDGNVLIMPDPYAPLQPGYAYVTDDQGNYLTDPDGWAIIDTIS